MAVSDVRTCPKCGQYQMPACMCALRAANAALSQRLRQMHLLLALAWGAIRAGRDLMDSSDTRFGEWCEGVDCTVPEWEQEARALLHPQAAEPIVLGSIDAAEAAVSNVIRWLDSHKLIYGGLGDELETEKLIEDAKIGIGLIRYEVAAELPCPTIEQVEGAYGEAMYEQERETR